MDRWPAFPDCRVLVMPGLNTRAVAGCHSANAVVATDWSGNCTRLSRRCSDQTHVGTPERRASVLGLVSRLHSHRLPGSVQLVRVLK